MMSRITRLFNGYGILSSVRRNTLFSTCFTARTLFQDNSLRMDVYLDNRQIFLKRVKSLPEFWQRITALCEGRNIYEEDIKLVCYIAEKEHVPLVQNLLATYITTPKSRLGDFHIGPVVMRLYHFLNEPVAALELFRDKETHCIFNYQASIIVFLDLLFKNEMYDEVVEVFDEMVELEWFRTVKSRGIPIPYILALYMKGTKESLQKALKFYETVPNKHLVLRRMPLAIAKLALKCNEPQVAVKLASRYPSYHVSVNILIQAYIQMKDWKRVTSALKTPPSHELLKDTVELLSESLKDGEPHTEQLKKYLAQTGRDDDTVDSKLLSTIEFTQLTPTALLKKREGKASLIELQRAFRGN